MPRRREPSIAEQFESDRCDYEAAKRSSRFQRRRRGVPTMGAGADFHYASEADFLWLQEVAWDLYRNDGVIGQITDRAVINTIGSGFTPDPDTGDKGLDRDLKARWAEESCDPDCCDLAGELTFYEQEIMACRDMMVPGDTFGVFSSDGTVQMIESHRCRSPQRTQRNIVHGIERSRRTNARERFWFTKQPLNPLAPASKITMKDIYPVDARDADGEAQVLHVYNPKRTSQTRGVTAYAPIILPAGMFDDLNFANLLKAQLNSHWLVIRERQASYFEQNSTVPAFGTANDTFSGTRRVADTAPGMEIGGLPGETIKPWNPNNPPAEFFPHARLILTIIGINLGMPLVLVLMDASETNFSGFRGAVDQARLGFRHNQRILVAKWHRPYWRMKISFWADDDPALAGFREKLGPAYFKHKWNRPGWPYIEPTKDAQSDLLRAAHMQTSLRRLAAERGNEWPEIVDETIADRLLAITKACQAAQDVNRQFDLAGTDIVSWRDLAPLPTPQGISIALKGDDAPEDPQNDQTANAA